MFSAANGHASLHIGFGSSDVFASDMDARIVHKGGSIPACWGQASI